MGADGLARLGAWVRGEGMHFRGEEAGGVDWGRRQDIGPRAGRAWWAGCGGGGRRRCVEGVGGGCWHVVWGASPGLVG